MAPQRRRRRPPVVRSPKWRRLSAKEASDKVITSLVLPRKLHEQVVLAATRLNWSMAELCRQALEIFLSRHAEALKEARP